MFWLRANDFMLVGRIVVVAEARNTPARDEFLVAWFLEMLLFRILIFLYIYIPLTFADNYYLFNSE